MKSKSRVNSSNPRYIVSGTLIGLRTRLGQPGLRVEAWDKDLVFDDFLGEAVTDAQGRFVIEFFEDRFREFFFDQRPDLYFKLFRGRTLAHSTQGSVLWNVASDVSNLVIEVPDVGSATGNAEFSLTGRVTLANGDPAIGARVEVLDQDLRVEQTLVQATTDAGGYYRALYEAGDFARAEKDFADLKIRVYLGGSRVAAAESGVVFNAPADATIDLQIPGVGSDEFARLTALLTPLLAGQGASGIDLVPAELTEADLVFLAAETLLEHETIRLWALALSTAAAPATALFPAGQGPFTSPSGGPITATEVESVLNFGWFRQGQPQAFAARVRVASDLLILALQYAARQLAIADLLAADPTLEPAILRALDLRRKQVPTQPAEPGRLPSLGDMLNTVAPDWLQGWREEVAALLATADEEAATFLAQAQAIGLGLPQAKLLRRTLRLANLTDRHPALVSDLNQRIGGIAQGGTDDDALVGLATVTTADWFNTVGRIGLPAGSNIDYHAYARALERAVENIHPTPTLIDRLDPARPRFGAPLPNAADVHAFLRASPQFDIVTSSIEKTFAGGANVVKASLLPLQRIKRLSASWDETASLVGAGVRTLSHIIDAGPLGLAAMLGGIDQRPRATELHAAAMQARDSSLVLLANIAPRFNPLSLSRFSPAPMLDLTRLADYPTIQGLFGDLDTCACTTCQSVLSPAAYLVDLLQFLRTTADVPSAAFTALMRRRPDLVDIELTCENTETELPQLDLALEVLENAVALPLRIEFADGDDVAAWFGAISSPNAAPANPIRTLLALTVRKLPDVLTAVSGGSTATMHVRVPTARMRPLLQRARRRSLASQGARLQMSAARAATTAATATAPTLQAPSALRTAPLADAMAITGAPLQPDRAWTVTGGGERWSLVEQHAAFVSTQAFVTPSSFTLGSPVQLTPSAETVGQWTTALAAGTLTAELKAAIAEMTAAPWDYRDALLSPPQTPWSPLQDDEGWHVVAARDAWLLIKPHNGDRLDLGGVIELYAADGTGPLATIPVPTDLRPILDALRDGRVPDLVGAVLPAVRCTLQIVADQSAGDGRVWGISYLFLFYFSVRPNAIDLQAIAYQSSHADSRPMVEPEYRDPEAYRVLAAAVFPWSLPFELDAESDRLLFGALGTSRLALREALCGPDPWAPIDPVVSRYPREVLGLLPTEFDLVAVPAAGAVLWTRWGLAVDRSGNATVFDAVAGADASGPPLALLARVSILLQQAALSFDELLDLLQTVFVGAAVPGVALAIVQPSSCKTSELTIQGLAEAHLDACHRFVRLWRHSGLSMYEFDLALSAAPGGERPFSDVIVFVAQVRHLVERLGIPAETLLAQWLPQAAPAHRASMTPGAPSIAGLFERTFQNPRVANPPDARFLLRPSRDELAYIGPGSPPVAIEGDVLRLVASSLGIGAADVAALGAAVRAVQPNPDPSRLRLRNLGNLMSLAPLMARMGLPADDVGVLMRLVDDVPLNGPAVLERMADLAASAGKAGFELPELAWLLLHDEAASGGAGWSEARRTQFIAGLAQTIAALETQFAADQAEPDAAALTLRLRGALSKLLAAGVGADEGALERLLSLFMTWDADAAQSWLDGALDALREQPPVRLVALDRGIQRLQKAAFVLKRAGLDARALRWIAPLATLVAAPARGEQAVLDLGDLFERLDVVVLSVVGGPVLSAWRRLFALAALRQAWRQQDDLVDAYLLALGTSTAQARELLATTLGTTATDVAALLDARWRGGAGLYRDPLALERAVAALLAFQALGVDVSEASRLADASDPMLSRRVLSAKLGAAGADTAITQVNDVLLARQRGALVSYLVQREWLRSADDLYDHFLIDTQVAAAPTTTRLLQATQSVQLFIQRCLLGQEREVALSESQHGRWQWMSAYRAWEANRKVFLYPENWLHPELRGDATDAFKKAESALTQGDANAQNALAAAEGYLDDALQVSRVQVLGMHVDRPAAARDVQVLYAVGRSIDEPHDYFWRQCDRFSQPGTAWGGWVPIGGGVSGDHVTPFMLNGQPAVAWCTFEPSMVGTLPVLNGSLAWTTRARSGWTKPATVKNVVTAPVIPGKDIAGTFAIRVRSVDYVPQLSLGLLAAGAQTPIEIPEVAIYVGADRAIDVGQPSSFTAAPAVARVTTARRTDSKRPGAGHTVLVKVQVRAIRVYVNGTFDPVARQSFHLSQFTYLPVAPVALAAVAARAVTPSFAMTPEERDRQTDAGGLGGAGTTGSSTTYGGYTREVPELPTLRANTDANGSAIFADLFPPRSDGDLQWVPFQVVTVLAGTTYRATIDLPEIASGTYLAQLTFRIVEPGLPAAASTPHAADEPVTMREAACVRLVPHAQPQVRAGDPSATLGLPHGMYAWGGGYRGIAHVNATVRDGAAATDLALLGNTDGDVYVAVASDKQIALGDLRAIFYQDNQLATWITCDGGRFEAVTDGSFALREAIYSGLPTERLWTPELQRASDGGSYWQGHEPALDGVAWSTASITDEKFHFDWKVPFALYNWELFYHLPALVADHLNKQQRFSEADAWLRKVFDPLVSTAASGLPATSACWRFLPFLDSGQPTSITALLDWLASPASASPARTAQQQAVERWKDDPFQAHAIAHARVGAYQWRAAISYIQNVLDWGDQLFARDSREAINEAVQLYVLASQILGPRPKTIRRVSDTAPLTYRSATWDGDFSNDWQALADHVMVIAPAGIASSFEVANATTAAPTILGSPADARVADRTAALDSIGVPYFCIPANDMLLSLWDRAADRLLKIRMGQNIEGIDRDLALFDMPIDPDLLVRAAAAGLSIADLVAGLQSPPPTHRFAMMLQKATELCAEVKALGGLLLGVFEKRDAEALSDLRAANEVALMQMVEQLRIKQLTEAQDNTKTLWEARAAAEDRFRHVQVLLGQPQVAPPARGRTLPPGSSPLQLARDGDLSGEEGGLGILRGEQDQIARLVEVHIANTIAGGMGAASPVLRAAGALVPAILGSDLGASLSRGADAIGDLASLVRIAGEVSGGYATRDAILSAYQRRKDDWIHQGNQALRELAHIDRQLAVSELQEAVAQGELDNTRKQGEQARATAEFLRSKFTNQQLYAWMESQVATVCFQAYRLAHDAATRAEASFNYELTGSARGIGAAFIQPGYWDSLKRGLLAGEVLGNDLKRMESSFLERNRREFEITKHVSLRRIAPTQLKALRETGSCTFDVPEWLFDLDCPGHFLRRLRAVSLTLPCVVGPYTGVHCKLTLIASALRRQIDVAYDRELPLVPSATEAFITSSGNNDGGLFELNMKDERYLPFEGGGAISRWRLELPAPAELAAFDYATIPDVILHLRYTARDGRSALVDPCTAHLKTLFRSNTASGPAYIPLIFTARADFPSEWAAALASPARKLSVAITPDHVPYWSRDFVQVSGQWIDPPSATATGALPTPVIFETILPANSADAWLLVQLSREATPTVIRRSATASKSKPASKKRR